jgi:methylenetetrahydrofolate dehydrogenase (NAD+)
MVDPRIDLEGINPASLARSYLSAPPLLGEDEEKGLIYPCTPLAVVRILQNTGMYDLTRCRGRRLEGKVVTVVNR